jgi:antitoxin HicB
MWTYPISLRRDSNGSWLATAPDFPEVTTFGASLAQAQDNARDAIEEAIAARMADREDVPLPSKPGRYRTAIPTQTVLKVQLYRAMRGQNISKTALARRLHLHRPQIDRLLNVRHTTNLDTIDQAFAAIGYRVDVTVKRSAGQ